MFSKIGEFLAKRVLPLIIANADLDIDTVERSDGYYLRVRVEVFGRAIVDRYIKISGQKSVEMTTSERLQLNDVVDVRIPGTVDEIRRELSRESFEDFGKIINQ